MNRENESEQGRRMGLVVGGGAARRGPCKRSTVGQRFLLGVQEGGGRSGSMR